MKPSRTARQRVAASLIALSATVFASGAAAHEGTFSAGEPGDPKKTARVIQVIATEKDGRMIFIPDRVQVRRGEQIRFVIRNTGEGDHEFIIATTEENLKHAEEMRKNPDMEHDDPNGKRVASKKSAELVWRFTKVGTFEYGCLIPGHREAGMTGIIVVE